MSISLIILAAGQGSRMNSELPKVLHKIAASPLLHHALATGQQLNPDKTIVVVGHGNELVSKSAHDFDDTINIAHQSEQKGTGHAVAQAAQFFENNPATDVIILYGDTPFINVQTLEKMIGARSKHEVVVLGFNAKDPRNYGRLVMNGEKLHKIVEWKDTTDKERDITLCNSGVICINSAVLFKLISQLDTNNAAGEYYLTDIIQMANDEGLSVGVVLCSETETMGVNTRFELAQAEAAFQHSMRNQAFENGVTLVAPETVFFARDTYIGRNSIIEANVVFGLNVTIESDVTIRPFCHLEGCHISRGSTIGPFARLRPGAELAEDVHIGNFVEVKNTTIGEGSKVGHLSYLGDATLGKHVNIGAGTVTCNYDGVMKHHTHINDNAFIGSDTMLVAPVSVGKGALTASGSVITQNVPDDALALARAQQVIKLNFVARLFDKLKKLKAKKNDHSSKS